MLKEYYADDPQVMQIVKLGREMITKAESNEIYSDNDDESYELWNALVTAGNKFTTYGMIWSKFTELTDLSKIESKAVRGFLEAKAQ